MKKTDVHIQQDIIAELKWDPSIDATRIKVEVLDGDVTLTGLVSNQAEKLNVERSIKRVSGVNDAVIDLAIFMQDSAKKSDIEIIFRAINLLQWMSFCNECDIAVTVENALVTLTGEVDCKYQEDAVLKTIGHLVGVAGINNKINIKQVASTHDIKADIELALKRHLDAGADHILIDVRLGEVTLSGTVKNWHDATLAVKSASSTRGVWNVKNNISVNCE
jgi:osmotically-inducible protein OsmY